MARARTPGGLVLALAAVVAVMGAPAGAQQPAPQVRLAAPSDCLTNAGCGEGLARAYGLDVRTVLVPLTAADAGVAALDNNRGEVAVAFSSDPQLARPDLVHLADDRRMLRAEHIVPVVRSAVLRRLGSRQAARVRRRLTLISDVLTTPGLRALNQQLADGRVAEAVGGEFVEAHGLGRGRPVRGAPVLRVGYQDFGENAVLAHVYAESLRVAGFRARVVAVGGLRRATLAALARRAIDLYPGYTGSLRAELGGRGTLRQALARRGLVPLKQASAENRNVFVTTRDRAAALGLSRISDLRRYWPAAG